MLEQSVAHKCVLLYVHLQSAARPPERAHPSSQYVSLAARVEGCATGSLALQLSFCTHPCYRLRGLQLTLLQPAEACASQPVD